MSEGKKQAEALHAFLAGLGKGLDVILKEVNLDYFFALVNDAGEVATDDQTALQAARAGGAIIITLTPAEIQNYFPSRSRSFSLADATPAELKKCCEVAKEQTRENQLLDGTLPC